MDVRRVVTGVNAEGKSVIVSDSEPPNVYRSDWGRSITNVWAIDGAVTSVDDGGDLPPGVTGRETPDQGVMWVVITHPPATRHELDAEALKARRDPGPVPYWAKPKGPAFSEERPGFHSTETIDLVVVLDGELTLLLEEGETTLKVGECLVQRGTLHGWENRTDRPCTFSAVTLNVP